MNKTAIRLITLLLSTTLVVSCGVNRRSSNNDNDQYGDSDNSIISGDIPSTNPIDGGEKGELDVAIASFVSDLNINVPLVGEYDLSYSVYYYYAYGQYIISGATVDSNNFESSYLAKFTNNASLVSLNDNTYYTVEEYGYMFGDDANNPNLTITFYTEEGYFYLTITRADGKYGTLDVSNIDTNWYVDYVNFYGFAVNETFPETDINVSLEIDIDIPSMNASYYPYLCQAPYEDENGAFPLTYYVVFEGDQVKNYANVLKNAGFDVTISENTEQEIDWDTFEVVDVTYFTATAIDTSHSVYIYIYPDEDGNTMASFYKFSDVSNDELTTNTDWTEEEKELMNQVLGTTIPFMAFGANYEISDWSDSEYDCIGLEDTYYQDLSDDYITILLDLGYKKDSTSYDYTCYYYDNGVVYIEIFPGYENGHSFEIYSEPSHLPAITSFTLNKTAVDIVAGASYQLEAAFTPINSAREITWTSSNNDVATVSNGLVEIKDTATVGQTVTITASVLGGISATCTFTVVADSVTSIEYTKANYTIIPGGDKIEPAWITLPVGATLLAIVAYGLDGASNADGIYYDENGKLWATSDATPGKTFTITVTINSSLTASATVTVVEATVTHTLNQAFFGLTNNNTVYATHTKTTEEGATYEAQCASQTGIQIRSKSGDSGIIGHFEGRSCQSMTFTFASNTQQRTVNIYGSNSAFSIEDMYSMEPVGSIDFSGSAPYTLSYTFTSNYSYIGFRSTNGACYLDSIVIIWA